MKKKKMKKNKNRIKNKPQSNTLKIISKPSSSPVLTLSNGVIIINIIIIIIIIYVIIYILNSLYIFLKVNLDGII